MQQGPLDPPGVPLPARCHLAEVVAVDDPHNRGRVQVRLLAYDGVTDQDAAFWARVLVPFAGDNYGAFFIPHVGEEVLVQFANGDPRQAIVVGALWNGAQTRPETLGGDGRSVDRWTLTGRAGTRIAIVEEQSGQAKIELTTPGGVSVKLFEESGGKIELEAAGSTITIDTQGVTVDTAGKVVVNASQTEVTSGQVKVNAALSTFSGIVKCDVLQATTVVGTTYTPGAGNVW